VTQECVKLVMLLTMLQSSALRVALYCQIVTNVPGMELVQCAPIRLSLDLLAEEQKDVAIVPSSLAAPSAQRSHSVVNVSYSLSRQQ